MKRVIAFLVILILSFQIFPLAANAETGEDFEYTIENGEATITKYTGNGGDVVIPATTAEGTPIVTIGTKAFYNCDKVTSVKIPQGVTTIDSYAFRFCVNLTSIEIPDSVTSIGNLAFQSCIGLTTLKLPDSISSLASGAFADCDYLTSVNIPAGITYLESNVFSGCQSLPSIEIPGSVTYIGQGCFSGCEGFTSVTIPNGVVTIGFSAFQNCTNLTSVTIPASVTRIENDAFRSCTKLTTISLPDSVTSIGDSAFRDCSNLTAIKFPQYTFIGNNAFTNTPYQSHRTLVLVVGAVLLLCIVFFLGYRKIQKEKQLPDETPTTSSKIAIGLFMLWDILSVVAILYFILNTYYDPTFPLFFDTYLLLSCLMLSVAMIGVNMLIKTYPRRWHSMNFGNSLLQILILLTNVGFLALFDIGYSKVFTNTTPFAYLNTYAIYAAFLAVTGVIAQVLAWVIKKAVAQPAVTTPADDPQQ